MSGRSKALLWSVAGGAWCAVCWLPFGLAPLFPLGFVLVMRGLGLLQTPRDAVWFGVVNGVARYAVAAHFLLALTRHSVPLGIAFYLLAIAYIVPFAILEAWGAFTLERRFGLPRFLGFGLLWSLMEHVRTLGDISFPADLVPHAFGTHPAWLSWNRWIGPVGFTLLCFAVAALLHVAIEQRAARRQAVAALLIALALWLGPPLTDPLLATSGGSPARALRVGIVQPSIDVRDKLAREQWPALWERMLDLSVRASRGADLVVWPETARPGPLIWRDGEPLRDPEMQRLARSIGVPILYGCEIARVREGRVLAMYNGAAMVRPDRDDLRWYGKQRLLPFAEGIPFAEAFGWDPAKRARPAGERSVLSLLGNFRPGPGPTVFEVGAARIGVLICYEGLYPSLARAYANEGANALMILTNDAWWGYSVFAPWHARMVAARARELDLPVLRAANSGVSSSTDRRGVMVASTDLFDVTTLTVDLEPAGDGEPPITHAGLFPALILSTIAAAIGRTVLRQRRTRKPNSPKCVLSPVAEKVVSANVTSPSRSVSSRVEQRVP